MRSYSVAVAALAIDASHKWVDNLLSHFTVPHVASNRRGVARRIPHSVLLQLAVTRELNTGLAIGVRDALALATELLASDSNGVSRGGHLRVTYDRDALERTLSRRLHDALESAPAPRRGRPPIGTSSKQKGGAP